MSSLTKQQQTTLLYIIVFVAVLGLSIGLLYSLSSNRSANAKLKQELDRKEGQAKNVRPPTEEEQSKWTEQESQLANVLLTDQAVPQFFEDVSRIATENGIQRLSMNTDEVTIDPAKASSSEEAKVIAVGIRRYLSVTLKFQGQYTDVGRFLGAITKLNRPLEFHIVDLKRGN